MKATFQVPFEDFDYEGWAQQLGLEAYVEPDPTGGFLLHLEGERDDIDQFANELDWGPIAVNE